MLIACVICYFHLYLFVVERFICGSVLLCELKPLSASDHEIDLVYALFEIFRTL